MFTQALDSQTFDGHSYIYWAFIRKTPIDCLLMLTSRRSVFLVPPCLLRQSTSINLRRCVSRATEPMGAQTFKVDLDREDHSLFRTYSLLAFPVSLPLCELFPITEKYLACYDGPGEVCRPHAPNSQRTRPMIERGEYL